MKMHNSEPCKMALTPRLKCRFLPSVWSSSSADGPCHCPVSGSVSPHSPEPEGSSAEAQAAHSCNLKQQLYLILSLLLYPWTLRTMKENQK